MRHTKPNPLPRGQRAAATEAFLMAIRSGIGAECGEQFLREGADPFARDAEGLNAYQWAVFERDIPCFEWMLGSGLADGTIAQFEELAAFCEQTHNLRLKVLVERRQIEMECAASPTGADASRGPRL